LENEEDIDKAIINPFVVEGKVLSSTVAATGGLKGDILKTADLVGGFGKVIDRGNVFF